MPGCFYLDFLETLGTAFDVKWLQAEFRPPDKGAELKIICLPSQPKKHVVGTQKNSLDETVLLSTQNTCLN